MKKKYKTEFHIHTNYSKDSILSYFMLLVMLKIKKINTIAITDHNEINGALKYKNKLEKHHINVIVGEEIFTTKGEIIGLNLKEKINPNLTPKQTIKEIKRQKGLVYIPHPYDEKRYKTVLTEEEIKKNKADIDFIEIHNGRNITEKFSKKQEEITKKYELRAIIGSDAHTFFELGRNVVITSNLLTQQTLLENYKEVKFIKKRCINFSHTCTKYIRIIKMLFRGDINGIYRIINQKFKRKK